MRAEASYHDGLSAGLFQDVGKGLQPVHFISRTMTDYGKRYSQTEKDALAVRWATKQIQDVFTRSAQIQNHYGPQTSAVNV